MITVAARDPRATADPGAAAVGCLLGLCIGGALGLAAGRAELDGAAEGSAEGAFAPQLRDLPPGCEAIGAPAALALAGAESWVAHRQVVAVDCAERWRAALAAGAAEPGAITSAALGAFADGATLDRAAAVAARIRPGRPGDGALVRALPLVLAAGGDRVQLRRAAFRSAQVTHADPVAAFLAVGACLFAADLGRHPVREAARRTVQALCEDLPGWALAALQPTTVDPGGDDGVGVLGAVVGLLAVSDDLEAVVVAAANRGGDPGTVASVGALAGGLAGLRSGPAAIPGRWVDALAPALRARCERLAAALPVPATVPVPAGPALTAGGPDAGGAGR